MDRVAFRLKDLKIYDTAIINSSILLLHNNGENLLIFSSSQFHHFIIVTLSPIHTSLPIITSPLDDGWPYPLKLLNTWVLIWPKGYVVTQSVRWLPSKYIFTFSAIEQKFPIINFVF